MLLTAVAAQGCVASADDALDTSDEENLVQLDPKLEAAALANLKRIAREIDAQHLANYGALPAASSPGYPDAVAKAFLNAVKLEYQATPALLEKRVRTLASMVFFSAPEVTTDPKIGRVTPFHGMDDAAFAALMANEDFVFDSHVQANGGSPNGVRPFSVCETKFLINVSTGKTSDASYIAQRKLTDYGKYATAYKAFAQSCDPKDLAEWYNFRGLGGLRPSWLESNYNDRVLRRMLKDCKDGSGDAQSCQDFKKDRLAFRDKKNVGLALREMVFDVSPASKIGGMQDGAYMGDPNNSGVFVFDRNGDGVAEWLAPGPVTLVKGATIKIGSQSYTVSADGKSLSGSGGTKTVKSATLALNQGGQFGGSLDLTVDIGAGAVKASAGAGAIGAIDRVDAKWSASYLARPDLGLTKMFDSASGCSGDTASPDACPLIRRFYSLIDRHENFYQSYTSMDPTSSSVSSQPSPLVACSITLAASHQWDTAGTPAGGTAGFIYLMRIPFAQIFAGDTRSIDTLGRLKGDLKSGPKVLTVKDIYQAGAALDMSKVWLDIATLSHNQYSNEHEISKFGTVPAEQIEGVLVVRRPAAMGKNP